MSKLSNIFLTIFSVGVLFALFAGGFSVVGYIIAICIGGETATTLCLFIFKKYFPLIIKITSVVVGCGLVGMYLTKQKALTAKVENLEK